MKKSIIFSLVFVLALSGSVAMAADILMPSKTGNITVNEGDNLSNVYTAGNIVTINDDVGKDLVLAGNILTINGDVQDDLMAAGGTLFVRGDVGGSARIAGGNVVVEGKIAEDLMLGGGNVSILSSSEIGGDLVMGAGNVTVDSNVKGDIRLGGGNVAINARVDGDINAEADSLSFGPSAVINGDVTYYSKKEIEIDPSAQINGELIKKEKSFASADKKDAGKWAVGFLTIAFFVKLLAMIAIGLIFVYAMPKIAKPIVKEGLGRFWHNLAFGFAMLILLPVLAIICAITVIGLWLTGLILVFYSFSLMLAGVFVGILLGSWLIKKFKKRDEYRIGWPEVVWGVIAIAILKLIPFVGWIIVFVFMLVSLGAIYRLINKNFIGKK